MGISLKSVQFLADHLNHEELGPAVISYGHQLLTPFSPDTLRTLLAARGWPVVESLASSTVEHVDQGLLFRSFGFTKVDSLDIMATEGASLIFDLNEPLPTHLHEQYDLVYDGGTTEHIANPIQGFFNAVRLLKPGGLVIHQVPINGYMNHGYFQFSPIFFQDFYRQNGFEPVFEYYYPSEDRHPDDPIVDQLSDAHHTMKMLIYFAARKPKSPHKPKTPVQGGGSTLDLPFRQYPRLLGKKVVVWGTGSHYRWGLGPWLADHRDQVDLLGFVDSNPDTWGRTLADVPIFAPAALKTELKPDTVFIASSARVAILQALGELGMDHLEII